MESFTKLEQLNAETWDRCDALSVYGDYFVTRRLCPEPPGDRKFRLVVVAALRAVWPHLTDPRSRAAVEAAERYADDYEPDPLDEADEPAFQAIEDAEDDEGFDDPVQSASVLAAAAWRSREGVMLNDASIRGVADWAWIVSELESTGVAGRPPGQSRALHLRLFHDIFPNPFRAVAVDQAWLTPTVLLLAESIYADRAFDRLPILADALQEAGCDHADILAHCRGEGPHVRGCWVVDLVLGKDSQTTPGVLGSRRRVRSAGRGHPATARGRSVNGRVAHRRVVAGRRGGWRLAPAAGTIDLPHGMWTGS